MIFYDIYSKSCQYDANIIINYIFGTFVIYKRCIFIKICLSVRKTSFLIELRSLATSRSFIGVIGD